jgi:hypothetical protein
MPLLTARNVGDAADIGKKWRPTSRMIDRTTEIDADNAERPENSQKWLR